MSKRSDRPYRGGRTKDWIKIKNQQHELSINRTCGATASRVGIATGMVIVSSPPVDDGGAQSWNWWAIRPAQPHGSRRWQAQAQS